MKKSLYASVSYVAGEAVIELARSWEGSLFCWKQVRSLIVGGEVGRDVAAVIDEAVSVPEWVANVPDSELAATLLVLMIDAQNTKIIDPRQAGGRGSRGRLAA